MQEPDYKPDFEILDRYINFSSELLRLSLLGISGFGALVLFGKDKHAELLTYDVSVTLFISVIFFTISAALALSHRFYATDSMSYHISYLRKKNPAEKQGRNRRLKISEWLLITAEFAFGIGVLFFAAGIYYILFPDPCGC
jgi:hypothetical protein